MNEYQLRIGDTEYRAEVREITADRARIAVNGTEYTVDLLRFGRHSEAKSTVGRTRKTAPSPDPAPVAPNRPAPAGTAGSVRSPLPGAVIEVKVKEGEAVQAGQAVVIMEAMKMENTIPAPHNGTVKRVFVSAGDSVGEGDVLVEISRPEMTTL